MFTLLPSGKVSLKKFPYLGVVVTRKHDLFKFNFHLLGRRFGNTGLGSLYLLHAVSTQLKWTSCLSFYKIFLLFVGSTHFITYMEWKNTSYIKMSFKNPVQLALPNFQHYYWSCNIRALSFWQSKSTGTEISCWLVSSNSSLNSLLCSTITYLGYSFIQIHCQSNYIWIY